MKISTRMTLINTAFMINLALLSGLSIFQLYTLDHVYVESKTIAVALRKQVEADMMHDGLRADVLYAIKVSNDEDSGAFGDAEAGTKEHVETFNILIKEVEDLNISPVINEKLAALKEPLKRYTDSALKLTADALNSKKTEVHATSAVDINAEYAAFEKDFEYLEGAMSEFSTVIEDEFNNINVTVEHREEITTYMIAGSVLLALFIAAFSWISSSRKIVKPIAVMTGTMKVLASNKLDVDIPCLGQKDEIGAMAEAVQVFKQNALEAQRLREEQKALEERAAQEKRTMLDNLANGFEQGVQGMITSIASASTQLTQTAEVMSKVASETNQQSVEVASASEQASHNVQSVATAAEEMAATVQEISKQISLSNNIVNEARVKAEIADNSSKELVEMSKSVGAIATLIEDIAGQINLLALNATIESARSGEAGKGFAVVANEVKNLATQTAKATEQIRQQLEAVQNTASGVAGSLGQVREAIAKVSEGSAAIAAAVEEQSAATQEIVSNMNTATQGVEQINGGIFSIKGGTNSTTDATREVLDAARTLSGQAAQMDREVKNFLQNLLAA